METHDIWHMTHDMCGEVNLLFKYKLALMVLELRWFKDILTKDDSLSYLMNQIMTNVFV